MTQNLKDFPEAALEPYGIETLHPDDFLSNHLALAPGLFCSGRRARSAPASRNRHIQPKTTSPFSPSRIGRDSGRAGAIPGINLGKTTSNRERSSPSLRSRWPVQQICTHSLAKAELIAQLYDPCKTATAMAGQKPNISCRLTLSWAGSE